MKTLDEVIIMCKEKNHLDYDGLCSIINDALFYLQEYKKSCEDLINATKDLKKQYILNNLTNNRTLLTWEELKTMEGEVVWIELLYHHPEQKYEYLDIIERFDDIEGYELIDLAHSGYLCKSLLGKEWKAYRRGKK